MEQLLCCSLLFRRWDEWFGLEVSGLGEMIRAPYVFEVRIKWLDCIAWKRCLETRLRWEVSVPVAMMYPCLV